MWGPVAREAPPLNRFLGCKIDQPQRCVGARRRPMPQDGVSSAAHDGAGAAQAMKDPKVQVRHTTAWTVGGAAPPLPSPLSPPWPAQTATY